VVHPSVLLVAHGRGNCLQDSVVVVDCIRARYEASIVSAERTLAPRRLWYSKGAGVVGLSQDTSVWFVLGTAKGKILVDLLTGGIDLTLTSRGEVGRDHPVYDKHLSGHEHAVKQRSGL
jgi:hypothetical protein